MLSKSHPKMVHSIGYRSWAPHLNQKSIYLLKATTFNLGAGTCIFQICISCSICEFFFTFFGGADFTFDFNIQSILII